MIYSKDQIDLIRLSCNLVTKTHVELVKWIKPGITTIELNNIADKFIKDNGGYPGFLGMYGFPYSICTSVNSCVIHGFPDETPLSDGDIISIDIGVLMNGYWGDFAYTYCVGNVLPDVKKLIDITKESIYIGINQAISGNRTGDIGYAIQNHIRPYNYGIVKEFAGHGLGSELHQEPAIPNYGLPGTGYLLYPGMVIAIEPMINLGSSDIIELNDGDLIRTIDNLPSVHFEHNLVIRDNKAELLSDYTEIELEISNYS